MDGPGLRVREGEPGPLELNEAPDLLVYAGKHIIVCMVFNTGAQMDNFEGGGAQVVTIGRII